MDDPFAYMNYLFNFQHQGGGSGSIFDSIALWVVLAVVVPVFIKFALVASMLSSFRKSVTGGDRYKPGPLGMWGPLFGLPAVIPKARDEVESDRLHAYRKWGATLSALCIFGGLLLFVIGVEGSSSVELFSITTITNAAPGTILFVLGFLFWKNTK